MIFACQEAVSTTNEKETRSERSFTSLHEEGLVVGFGGDGADGACIHLRRALLR
jgi:hypothetical protein